MNENNRNGVLFFRSTTLFYNPMVISTSFPFVSYFYEQNNTKWGNLQLRTSYGLFTILFPTSFGLFTILFPTQAQLESCISSLLRGAHCHCGIIQHLLVAPAATVIPLPYQSTLILSICVSARKLKFLPGEIRSLSVCHLIEHQSYRTGSAPSMMMVIIQN